jgi:hypothetical protein
LKTAAGYSAAPIAPERAAKTNCGIVPKVVSRQTQTTPRARRALVRSQRNSSVLAALSHGVFTSSAASTARDAVLVRVAPEVMGIAGADSWE